MFSGRERPARPICLPPLARSACRALRVTVPDGIILDSHGEADTRCNEYPARGPGGLRAGYRARSPRATEDRHQGLLCVLDALWRSAEHEYVSRLPRSARGAAGPESPRRGTGPARGARIASERAGEFAVRPKELFLSRSAEGISDFHVRAAPRNGRMARDRT